MRAIFQVQAPGGLCLEGRFNGGFFALPVWGAYTWRGFFSEFYGIARPSGQLNQRETCGVSQSKSLTFTGPDTTQFSLKNQQSCCQISKHHPFLQLSSNFVYVCRLFCQRYTAIHRTCTMHTVKNSNVENAFSLVIKMPFFSCFCLINKLTLASLLFEVFL